MARDKALEALLNDELEGRAEITQKAMFGGLAWLWNGNLLCAARKDGGMLVRLGKGNDAWVLAIKGVAPMVMNGRQMSGWVRVSAEVYAGDAMRKRLLKAAMEFVKTLPAKG
ncbi:MAG: TfoX/Sxy family protein [Acidobacteria bacterium]|nr:TfoX/Sxy family protein [Acidobacteriota bacterium]